MADEAVLARDMEAAAKHAVGLLKKAWSVSLDFSEASVAEVEKVAGSIYTYIDEEERDTEMYSRYLGAYLGEVFRRHAGGSWAWWSDEAGTVPAIRCGETTLFPHDKVRKRLLNGSEENLEAYYQTFKALAGGQAGESRATPKRPPRRKAPQPKPGRRAPKPADAPARESALKITFPQQPAKFTGDGVVFQAIVDGRDVTCDISVEGLMRHYGVSDEPSRDEIMDAFRTNRGAIEQTARATIESATAKSFTRVRICYDGARVE